MSKTGFNNSRDGMLGGREVYFATCIEHTEFKANHHGAYICARVHVGNMQKTTHRHDPRVVNAICDTVYFEHPQGSDEFSVRDPNRIEEWIIVVNQDDNARRAPADGSDDIRDRFYGETYIGCIY
jgi:hypothetical protein